MFKLYSATAAGMLAIVLTFATAQDTMPASAPTSAPAGDEPIIEARVLFKAVDLPLRPLVENVRGGKIDWTTGQIHAVGEGQATGTASQQIEMAKRAARLDAARNASLLLGGIRVGPGGTFKNVKEGVIATDTVLTNFKETGDSFDPKTRIATVTLTMPLYGVKGAVSLSGGEIAAPASSPADADAGAKNELKIIVIDARGSGFKPCARPTIAGPAGKKIDGFASYSAGGGRITYGRLSLEYDMPDWKPGEPSKIESYGKVLIVRTQKSTAENPGTLVINETDTTALNQPATAGILARGQVIILADKP